MKVNISHNTLSLKRPSGFYSKNLTTLKKYVKSLLDQSKKKYIKPLSDPAQGNIAVFTQVKNEKVFLPLWIDHYSQYFKKEDLYVLDHQSNDGSTDNISANKITIKNPYVEDNAWRMCVLESFQKFLLSSYDCVIYVDADELLYNPNVPLNDYLQSFIKDPNHHFITTIGYEMYQNKNENPLLPGDVIVEKRSMWYRNKKYYDKTLISKMPLNWSWGFHKLIKPYKQTDYKYDVYLLHLHRMDKEIMIYRHIERTTKHSWRGDGGGHHFQSTREGVIKLFNSLKTPLEQIPQKHKNALKHLHIKHLNNKNKG